VESAEVDTSYFGFGERSGEGYVHDVGVAIALERVNLVVGKVKGPVDGSKKVSNREKPASFEMG
jgi:hypothetical protein